jgi:hypothetical protein
MARYYAELAYMTMPEYPEFDPFYLYLGVGWSELAQFEGKMCLHLAEHFTESNYAQQAYEALNLSLSKQAKTKNRLGQVLIRKADAARALGDMGECVTCLTNGFRIGIEIDSLRRLIEADEVMGRIPPAWQKETVIQNLQKDISHTIMVARR